jgi:hypothetical protein
MIADTKGHDSNMSEEATVTETETKKRESKKNSIPMTEIESLIAGIPSYTKTSFLVVGHKGGVRIAMPKTTGVSRAYFYGNDDYALVPKHDAITVHSEEARKAGRKGGIMAEVDFSKSNEQAREALTLLVAAVRRAEAPAAKAVKAPKEPKQPKAPKVPKAAKAAAAPVTQQAAEHGGGMAGHDGDTDGGETTEA